MAQNAYPLYIQSDFSLLATCPTHAVCWDSPYKLNAAPYSEMHLQTVWLNISSFAASYLFDSAAAQQKQNVQNISAYCSRDSWTRHELDA